MGVDPEEREPMGHGGENSRIREGQGQKPRGGSVFPKQPGWRNSTKGKEAGGELEKLGHVVQSPESCGKDFSSTLSEGRAT